MEYGSLRLTAGMHVGDEDNSKVVKEDAIFIFAGSSMNAIQDHATKRFGEYGSSDSSFMHEKYKVSDAILKRRENNRGQLDENERDLKRLIEAVQEDLGSIAITSAFCVLSTNGKQVIELRIEASEGQKRRIIKLYDQKDVISSLKIDALVQMIEAKF